MATVNESINAENQYQEENVHHISWFSRIVERIQELDTEFPLSGGEDGHVHVIHHKHTTPAVKEPAKNPVQEKMPKPEKAAEHHHTSWFSRIIEKIQDLDSDFPLSGGEHVN